MQKEDSLFVSKILERKQKIYDAKNALSWAFVNLFFAILLAIEVSNGFIVQYFTSSAVIFMLRTLESLFTLLFTVNAVYDIAFYSWPYCWMKPIPVTLEQKRLLAIKDNELGFITTPKKEIENKTKPFAKTPPFVMFPESSSPSTSVNQSISPLTMNSRTSFIASTPNLSLNYSSVGDTSASSWMFSKNLNDSNKAAVNTSFSPLNNSFLKKRNVSNVDSIKDESGLEEYLKNFELVEEKIHEMSKSEQQQLRNQNYIFGDLSNIELQTAKYQPASDIIVSTPNSESNLSSNMKAIDEFSSRLSCTESQLYQWIENIRSWISQTILLRLVTEIDKINECLSRCGLTESLVGEIGLSALKQLASLKHKEIPTLSVVLPYLELSLNQEYLVQRLKDLAKGGCITDFNWNRGASHKGKQWSEEWPTDAQIVMYLFCTYMDSRLPAHPSCVDGKPFTTMYFKNAAEHPSSKSQFYLLQSKLNPPHYNVVDQSDGIIEVPSGRNNIFYALILFLNIVNIKRFGLLGRVNLGPSGVNVLWTIEK